MGRDGRTPGSKPEKSAYADLPYRPCVGVMLISRHGLVFLGQRKAEAGPEHVDPSHSWQMPQGGIDPGEDIVAAAKRELAEETAITSVSLLSVTEEWWRYDFPPYDGPPHKLSGFRGQEQRWVALRFEGEDEEVDVLDPGSAEQAEFTAWDWFPLAELPELVTPFKRETYRKVAAAFAPFAAVSRYPVRLKPA
jgi:putative (di)nucleoside polyphosphate hydrolase